LNGVIAVILHYFVKLDSFAGRFRYSGTVIVRKMTSIIFGQNWPTQQSCQSHGLCDS